MLLKLAVMLGVGLLVRHVAVHLGRALAGRTTVRVPALCGYALAGTLAAGAKYGLQAWGELHEVTIWIVFGALWGLVAGTLLPLARRPSVAGATGS